MLVSQRLFSGFFSPPPSLFVAAIVLELHTLQLSALYLMCVCVLLVPVSLSPQEANQFLSRHKRANQVFEETKQGHLERECVEERCTKEEAREVFENDPETVSMCWTREKVLLSFLKSRARAGSLS